MDMSDPDDSFFLFENRLASFQGAHFAAKTRASNASTRAPKVLHWPHKSPLPVELARVGFFFEPFPGSTDNVVCFLCGKSLDGWEEGDDPLMEHLKHSPDCGWAISAAVEAEVAEYASTHPLDPRLLDARKATFAGKWPYESKKGFKCKTKQLAEAGWKYTPTLEADDMVTCTYCQLGLDGWEAGDKPIDEHYKRAPDCPFFTLISQNPPAPPPKRPGRPKTARSSKASRISIQSVATAISEMPSTVDITADPEDSVMTAASSMTQGGKRVARGRKAATANGRKTRAKKDEVVEIHEDEVEELEVPPPPPPPPPPPKPTRGRKRGSDAMEDSVVPNAEAPAPKKRATRAKGSTAVDVSIVTASQDVSIAESAPAKPGGRKKAPARSARKPSQSSLRSQASTASLRAHVPDDDEELDRQLQADLERPLTDDEELAAGSDSDSKKPAASAPARGRRPKKDAAARKTGTQNQKQLGDDYAMFDPESADPDEAIVEAEIKALEEDTIEAERAKVNTRMEVVELGQQTELEIPKKGRKAGGGTRKVSKQTKKGKKSALVVSEPVDEPTQDAVPIEDPAQEASGPAPDAQPSIPEGPDASTATVAGRPSNGKRGRGRPSKKSAASQKAAEEPELLRPPAPIPARIEVQIESANARDLSSGVSRTPDKVSRHTPPKPASVPYVSTPTPVRFAKPLPAIPGSISRIPRPPATPGPIATPSAKQATLSPSQSPQSSDAENQPPSSRPPPTTVHKRVVLAPVVATPTQHGSPTRRNIVAGLRSMTPWRPIDVDMLFSPGATDENGNTEAAEDGGKENGVDKLLLRGAELTSPEKRMTVEEWIYHNAGQAEQKLQHECEAMVSSFEQEGTRAMRVLEGLIVE